MPLYIEINDLIVPYYSSLKAKKWLVKMISINEKQDFRRAAGLIVPSEPMRRWLIERYHLSHGKVHFVPNGADIPNKVPLEKKDARKRLKMPLDCFCLGFVGNIYDRYDFETLLKAIDICRSKIPEIFLLIIGDGPLRNILERKVSRYEMAARSLFTGYVDSELLGNYLPAIDAGVLILNSMVASRYGPLNTKSSTYGIFKIAVIVSCALSIDCQDELINSLFVTQPDSPEALADVIVSLHDNPTERERRAKMFHSLVKSKMTWEACSIQILGIVKNKQY